VDLSTPLRTVLQTTQAHLDALAECGCTTVGELLLYLPRAHEDLSQVQTIASAPLGEKVTLRGTIGAIKLIRTRSRLNILKAPFTDAEGTTIEVTWFNQPHLKRMLTAGQEVVLTGKLKEGGNLRELQSPVIDTARGGVLVHAGRIVPIYPQHDVISTRWLREKMLLVRPAVHLLPETLPTELIAAEQLPSRAEMVEWLHFPDTPEHVTRALERQTFEEAYALQLQALTMKQEWQGTHEARLQLPMRPELIRAFFASLQFTPTDDQRRAIYEILRDMEQDHPMSRLLEGDVGSGKTLVATAVAVHTIAHGGQVALMAPTEVLARQHAEGIARTLQRFSTDPSCSRPPVVALLTGSLPASEADDVRRRAALGLVDLLVGTHALAEETVQFSNLLLAIVDEQHRFGVNQRQRLREKGNPHVLTMTATPIPRTLALTAFGHHDLSVLLSKPKNRKPIKTRVVRPSDRPTVERFIDRQIEEGRQVFVVCPLISEGANPETLDLRSVEAESARLQQAFPHRRIAVLHGQMSGKEKEATMQAFRAKESDILVSTSVIEVGVDVPNATIMVIEGAERFGLAQLHQFRGRVGRSEHPSTCFLFPSSSEQADSRRLQAMEQYDSGFQLAEVDLQLRGPGELFGIRQSGLPEARVSTLLQPQVILRARQAAERTLGLTSTHVEA
jgi:ATP-dependent DNA helicase RecG